MGAARPHDHPHVYLDMGHEAQIVCPYCSTPFVHDGALKATESDPPLASMSRPPRRAHRRLEAAFHAQAARARSHCRRRHRRPCGSHRARPARDRDRGARAFALHRRDRAPASSSGRMPRARLRRSACWTPSSPSPSGRRRSVIYDGPSGRRLQSVPLGKSAEERYGAPYLTLHRADLHAGLRAVAENLTTVTLRPSFEVTAIETQDGEVVAADARRERGQGREPDRRRRLVVDGPLPRRSRGKLALHRRYGMARARAARRPALTLRCARSRALARAARPSRSLPGPRRRRTQCRRRYRRRRSAQGWNQAGERRTLLAVHRLGQGFEIAAGTRGGWRGWSLYRLRRFRRLERWRDRAPGRRGSSRVALPRARRRARHRGCSQRSLRCVAACARRPGRSLSPL